MVLASQAELSDGKIDAGIFIGHKAVPSNKEVESSHSECQMGAKVIPDPMSYFLAMAHRCQHREYSLYEHPQGQD